jgi:hypothetical protein
MKNDEKDYNIKGFGEIIRSLDHDNRTGHWRTRGGVGMTRGPQPLMAIRGAQEIAHQREVGIVLDKAGMLASHYDFVIFGENCTVCVRVKRIRAHISTPQEIARLFNEEIRQRRRVPKTAGVSREIWVLSPWKRWQYSQVLDDQIVEVRCDGQPVLVAEQVSGET